MSAKSNHPRAPGTPREPRLRRYLYRLIARYVSFFTPADAAVLEVKPRTSLLMNGVDASRKAAYQPSPDSGFGADESVLTKAAAVRFEPDRVVLNGTLHVEPDIQAVLEDVHELCSSRTRLVVVYYSSLWKPLFRVARALGFQTKGPEDNWIAPSDLSNLLAWARFKLVTSQAGRWSRCGLRPQRRHQSAAGTASGFRIVAMLHIAVARPLECADGSPIRLGDRAGAQRGRQHRHARPTAPRMGPDDELIFVEGHSSDNTWEEIKRAPRSTRAAEDRAFQQTGKGKGDAVRLGFADATGDVLMILDADLTVPPEDLPTFYDVLVGGHADFVQGTRLVYPMEPGAMRFFNKLGNSCFSQLFTTCCSSRSRTRCAGPRCCGAATTSGWPTARAYFGDFDPFGDFDLIFGAARLNLKIVEIPVRYRDRTYGATNIQRWKHGWLLLRMSVIAARRLKFV